MLLKLFPSLNNSKIIKAINWFFNSYIYVALIGLLTALCCIFGFEIYAFYVYVSCACIIPALLCKDMKPLLAPLAMAFASISLKTNNSSEGLTVFGGRWHHLFILLGLIIVPVIARLIFELATNKEKRQYKHYLLPGFLVFGFTLIFAGFGSEPHTARDFLFGLIEFIALFGAYFLLMYLINWKDVRKNYVLWVMFTYGVALCIEIIVIQILNKGEGVQTGWGCNNNIAGQLCMCIAAPLCMALKKKISPLFLVIGFIFVVCVALTNSRNGTAMSIILGLSGAVILFVKGSKWKRIVDTITIVVSAAIFFTFFFVFRDTSEVLFGRLLHTFDDKKNLLSLSGRIPLWKEGWANFLSNKSFGTGWYGAPAGGRGNYFSYNFMPPRYHNTFFQLVGSMGLLGLLAYVYHRYQTIRLTFTKPNLEKTFLFLSLLGLLLTSLFDCHLFNLGPGLNYGILLAAIEGSNLKAGITVNRMRKPKFLN